MPNKKFIKDQKKDIQISTSRSFLKYSSETIIEFLLFVNMTFFATSIFRDLEHRRHLDPFNAIVESGHRLMVDDFRNERHMF